MDDIDKMRHSATRSLLERTMSLSWPACPVSTAWARRRPTTGCSSTLKKGWPSRREKILSKLVEIQYERNDVDFHRGTFRVRGDVIEVFPAHEESKAIRIELFGDEVDALSEVDPLREGSSVRSRKCPFIGKSLCDFSGPDQEGDFKVFGRNSGETSVVEVPESAPRSPELEQRTISTSRCSRNSATAGN